VVQLAFTLLFLALPWVGGGAVAGSLVALRLGPVDLVEPASALSGALAARALPWVLVLGALPLVLLGLVLGPVYCSWACPFGFVSELRDRLRPRGSRRWTGHPSRSVRPARHATLALLLSASLVLGIPLAALLAPPRLITVLPLELRAMRAVPVVTACLLGLALAIELLGPRRLICRTLCPAGSLGALLRTGATLAPRFDAPRCRCPELAPCLHECPWGIDPREMQAADGCTTCLACVERCPTGALTIGRRRPGAP
jgi:ferredoxin-type protein NapH